MKNNNKLFIIMVIYNKEINKKWLKLTKNDNTDLADIIFVDNSTNPVIKKYNKSLCSINKKTYIDATKNVGLSKAYNMAINFLLLRYEIIKENTWIMTLDQDTYVSYEYFNNILQRISEKNSNFIKTGIIEFDKCIGSPAKLSKLKKIKKNNNIWSNIECINSCLTVRLDKLLAVNLYDDRLFLDQVDRLILYKLRRIGIKNIEIINGKIKQDFSGDKFTTKKNDSVRFKIYKKDTLAYISISKNRIISMLFSIFKRYIHIKLHYLTEPTK